MADLMRHTAVWSGGAGLPGYSQFYHSVSDPISESAQNGGNAVRSFFNALASLIPSGITVQVDPVVQILDEATGEISSEVTVGTAHTAVPGTYVSNYSAQVGVLIEWTTGLYVDGRRLRGRTYLVPLGNVGDDDGTLSQGTLDTVNGATSWIYDVGEDFRVWHRPKGTEAGSSASILAGVVRDKAAILRSRMV